MDKTPFQCKFCGTIDSVSLPETAKLPNPQDFIHKCEFCECDSLIYMDLTTTTYRSSIGDELAYVKSELGLGKERTETY